MVIPRNGFVNGTITDSDTQFKKLRMRVQKIPPESNHIELSSFDRTIKLILIG